MASQVTLYLLLDWEGWASPQLQERELGASALGTLALLSLWSAEEVAVACPFLHTL